MLSLKVTVFGLIGYIDHLKTTATTLSNKIRRFCRESDRQPPKKLDQKIQRRDRYERKGEITITYGSPVICPSKDFSINQF